MMKWKVMVNMWLSLLYLTLVLHHDLDDLLSYHLVQHFKILYYVSQYSLLNTFYILNKFIHYYPYLKYGPTNHVTQLYLTPFVTGSTPCTI
jgi:hypothetical protein